MLFDGRTANIISYRHIVINSVALQLKYGGRTKPLEKKVGQKMGARRRGCARHRKSLRDGRGRSQRSGGDGGGFCKRGLGTVSDISLCLVSVSGNYFHLLLWSAGDGRRRPRFDPFFPHASAGRRLASFFHPPPLLLLPPRRSKRVFTRTRH